MLRILINNQQIDIGSDKELSIKLNRAFLDLQNVDSRSGDWSFSVRLPKTKTNNLIFGNIQDYQTIDKFVKTEEYSVSVYDNGTLIIQGYFKLSEIDEDSYNGNFISNVISWSKELSKLNLNEVKNIDGTNWTVPFRGSLSSSTPYSLSWYINQGANYDLDVAFPLVSYGNFFSQATLPFDSVSTYELTLENFPQSVYYGRIITKIFEGIGWSVDGGIFNDSEFRKLVIPYTFYDYNNWNFDLLTPAMSSGSSQAFFTDNLTPTTDPNNFNATDSVNGRRGLMTFIQNGNSILNLQENLESTNFSTIAGGTNTGFVYDVPVTTTYNLDINVNDIDFNYQGLYDSYSIFDSMVDYADIKAGIMMVVDTDFASTLQDVCQDVSDYLYDIPSGNHSDVTHPNVVFYYDFIQASAGNKFFWQPYQEDANITVDVINSGITYSPATGFGDYYTLLTNPSINIQIRDLKFGIGEKLKLFFVYQGYTKGQPHDIIYTQVNLGYTDWNIWGSVTGDTELNLTKNLPESVSQLEFIKTFSSHFNLYFTADVNKKVVRFDTYDDFFLPTSLAHRLDNVDLNDFEPAVKPVNLPRTLKIGYSNDQSDALLKTDLEYGNIEAVNDNIFCSTNKEIKVLFSATKLRNFKLYGKYYIPMQSTIDLPSIADDSATQVFDLTSVELSYTNSMRILKLTDYYTYDTGQTLSIYVDGYICKVQLSVFESDYYLSLKFDGEHGLYNRFYERFLNEFGDSHIITLNANITSYDYSKMQPNVPILIHGNYYILNSISGFDPISNGKTKIELLKKFSN